MRSLRSYQREIKKLKSVISNMQWVAPAYNGADSCAYCGEMRHHGCAQDCAAAVITKDFGKKED